MLTYICGATLPLVLILIYESIYAHSWLERRHARIVLACGLAIILSLYL